MSVILFYFIMDQLTKKKRKEKKITTIKLKFAVDDWIIKFKRNNFCVDVYY